VVFWDYVITIVLPVILTFTKAARDREDRDRSQTMSRSDVNSVREVSVKPPQKLEFDANGNLLTQFELDELLADSYGLECFRKFSVELFKAELVEFYLLCQNYVKVKDPQMRRKLASRLYHTFIRETGPLQVNLSYKIRAQYDQMFEDGLLEEDINMEESRISVIAQADKVEGPDSPSLPSRAKESPMAQPSQSELEMTSPNDDVIARPSYIKSPTLEREKSREESPTPSPNPTPIPASNNPLATNISFRQPMKEVKSLILDDWALFKTSTHWTNFVQELHRRHKMEQDQEPELRAIEEASQASEEKEKEKDISRSGYVLPPSSSREDLSKPPLSSNTSSGQLHPDAA